jgi:hypothetical protein
MGNPPVIYEKIYNAQSRSSSEESSESSRAADAWRSRAYLRKDRASSTLRQSDLGNGVRAHTAVLSRHIGMSSSSPRGAIAESVDHFSYMCGYSPEATSDWAERTGGAQVELQEELNMFRSLATAVGWKQVFTRLMGCDNGLINLVVTPP